MSAPMLRTTVYLDRVGRWRWKITASTIPAGGTRVDAWFRWGRARAERKAAEVSEARNRGLRYAVDSHVITPPRGAE